jgi:aspartyl-tRNA(Asn)/glutamyl-tRNA(Gln) amidotransferase subunit C
MELSLDDVRKIGVLARLELDDNQVSGLQGELNNILNYVEQMSELDLEGVEPTTHAATFTNSGRADVLESSMPRETFLMNAPQSQDGSVLIPRIVAPGDENAKAAAAGMEGGA